MRTQPFHKLWRDALNRGDIAQARQYELWLAIMAGEAEQVQPTLFGKRVVITLTWPDGLPLGCADETQLQDKCRPMFHSERNRIRVMEMEAGMCGNPLDEDAA